MSDSSSNTGRCSPRTLSRPSSRDLLKESVSPAQSQSRSRDSSPCKNQHRRSGSKSSLSGISGPEGAAGPSDKPNTRAPGHGHGHRRKKSSVAAGSAHLSGPRRGSGSSVFDGPAAVIAAPVPLRSPFTFPSLPIVDSPSSAESGTFVIYPPTGLEAGIVEPDSATSSADDQGPVSPYMTVETVHTPRKKRVGAEDDVRARLTSFSFGAKPAPRSPMPNESASFDLLSSPTPAAARSPLVSPRASRILRTSHNTPSSRPPSLLFTYATPSGTASPQPYAPLAEALQRESRGSLSAGDDALLSSPLPAAGSVSPGPAAGRRRHSHTRSNSISMPNLKLARPGSLGVQSTPSLPGSPNSPMNERLRPAGSVVGSRLKFEPSGRGAEAEKQKEDYRRQALEKLTGGSPRPQDQYEPREPEISLPELDDDDASSSMSSLRPNSFGSLSTSSGAFSFGRPNSLGSLGPAGLGISYGQGPLGLLGPDSPPTSANLASPSLDLEPSGLSSQKDRWITPGLQSPATREDGLGLGPLSANGYTEFSPGPVTKRASMTTSLGVLAEVDETEEEEAADAEDEESEVPSPTGDTARTDLDHEPTPPTLRLKQLHLTSIAAAQTPPRSEADMLRSFSLPRSGGSAPSSTPPSAPHSLSRPFAASGRARPRPLSGINGPVMLPAPGSIDETHADRFVAATQVDISPVRPRVAAASTSSRASSISYKRTESKVLSPTRDRTFSAVRARSPSSELSGSTSLFSASSTSPVKAPLALADGPQRPSGRPAQPSRSVSLPMRSAQYSSARASRQPSDDSAGDYYDWKSERAEQDTERNVRLDDAQMWRARCALLEDRLEAEKRESAMLRERVRKLGDRLSALSTERPDLQLWGQDLSIDGEGGAVSSTQGPVAALGIPQAIITPATPLVDETSPLLAPTPPSGKTASPDPSKKFRAWRLPTSGKLRKAPPCPPTDEGKRDSFFGLSAEPEPATGDSVRDTWGGVDLPPFGAETGSPGEHEAMDGSMRSLRRAQRQEASVLGLGLLRSPSTGYVPLNVSPTKEKPGFSLSPTKLVRSLFEQPVSPLRGDEHMRRPMDFRKSCRCCTGPVIEL